MTLLVTGGTGFVLSHVVRQWLERHEEEEVVVVDRAGFDASAEVFFRPVRERMRAILADVVDTASWTGEVDPAEVTELIAGAALSPITNDPALSPDRDTPAETVRVNILGAARTFDWARSLPNLRRLVYMSSGVYGYGTKGAPEDPPEPPIGEDEPLEPDAALYDISKATGELIARRFADVFGLSCVSVRPSAVYGPMDRHTDARQVHPLPWHMAHRAVAGDPLSVNSLDAGYDWVYAPDVARAILCLLEAETPRHSVYNIGYGRPASAADLLEGVRAAVPDFELIESDDDGADYVQPRHMRGGVWRIRSSQRLEEEFGWRPTPHRQAMAEYVRWLRDSGAPA